MNRFIEIAGAIGSQRHLVAIRDGFVAIMPLIIIGSFAVLLNNFPPIGFIDIVSFLNNIFGEGNWQTVGSVIWNATFAILGLLATFTIAYNLAISYEIDGLSAAIISAASYIMLVPITKDGGLNFEWLGAQGLFVGIIIALLVTELFKVLVRSKWTIKMPEGVPYGVVRSFEALIPASLILVIIGIFQALITVFVGMSIFEVIFNAIQEPLQGLGNTLPAAIIISLSNHVLWFFGLHGTNIIGSIIEPLYLPLIEENMNAFSSGMSAFEVPYIVTKPFLDAFVFMGGSGTTIALIIAIFIVIRSNKNHPYKKIAGLSAPASVFNINEPIIFGLPIVLNPAMLIPFILIPVLLTVISYLALAFGLVPKTVAIIPWTTPPILSGYLVTGGSWQGIALQVVNIIIAVLLYIPFVYSGYKAMNKEMEDNKNEH
ncbi:PTS sugar transporter subunit IIC [Mammaliicoccus sp. JADD-157]|uniref:PTS sugar transporter subunit IIC n=1 Tax=Mammaliicoccus sp. JADD-157 TaxID=3404818 RepID=UPI003BB736CF